MLIRKKYTTPIFLLIVIFFIIFVGLINPMTVAAQDTEIIESLNNNDNSYPLLKDFLAKTIMQPSNVQLKALNANNENVASDVISLYLNNQIELIADMIKNNNLQLSLKTTIHSHLSSRGSVITEKFFQEYYQLGSSHGIVKEWVMGLNGTITYSIVSKKILSASSPSVQIIETGNFGAAFYPYITNVSTGRTINSTSVNFWGKYTMMAGTNLTPEGSHNFGTYTLRMVSYPSF